MGPRVTARWRRADWPEALKRCIDRARRRPFAWGRHDCCLFAADCVAAMTGCDPAAGYRGRYRSQRAAYALLRRGHGTIAAACTATLGEPLVSPAWAQRGDVVLMTTPLGPATGICLGVYCAVAAPAGLAFVPTAAGVAAWRT